MTNWYDDSPTYTELGETIVVGRPAFVASFQWSEGGHEYAQQLFAAWLTLVPPKTALYYSHDKSKRFSKLAPKAITKVQGALAPANVAKDYAYYFVKSAPAEGNSDECHAYSLEIFTAEGTSGFAFVTFPRDHVEAQGAGAVVAWFSDWCRRFAFTHAGAGFGYELAWFPEQAQHVGPRMLSTGLRFHGVRVWERNTARYHEGKKTLDTAAWLTYLGAENIAEVTEEAIAALPQDVGQHRIDGGVVLQAGPAPDPCDTNRRGHAYALLKSVNDVIIPIRTEKWWIGGWGSADREKELSWFSRMDK